MRHELLPLHHRLRREGHDSEAVVWRPRYERAWDGSVTKIIRHSDSSLHAEALAPAVKEAEAGKVTVLTNVHRVAELFGSAPGLFRAAPDLTPAAPKDRLLLGGWFDGESVHTPHLLVADWGAWPGGLGSNVLGGLTLVRLGAGAPPLVASAIDTVTQVLKSASFKGLFHFDVAEDLATGEMQLQGLSAGWPWLHTQAFVAELENLGGTLTGETPRLRHKFVTVLPVTQPPWPNEKRGELAEGVEVGGLTGQAQGKCFWFDIVVDRAEKKLRTAGLDGLLCVATGASDATAALARAKALELAMKIEVPEKQYRVDAGAMVDAALNTLEERWGFVV